MAFCNVKNPPEYTTDIRKWDRETLADGQEMAVEIEQLFNNTFYNKSEIDRINHVTEITLIAAGWTGSAAPYTQTVNVSGMIETDRPTVSLYLPAGIAVADVDLQSKAYDCVNRAVSGNGNITVYCYKKKPAVDFQIQVKGA